MLNSRPVASGPRMGVVPSRRGLARGGGEAGLCRGTSVGLQVQMVDWFCYAADFVGFERFCGWGGESGGEEEQ